MVFTWFHVLRAVFARDPPRREKVRATTAMTQFGQLCTAMSLPIFDAFVAIDWSGARNSYKGIAVAKCTRGRSAPQLISSQGNGRWTRTEIADWLCGALKGRARTLIGLDFAFGFPFASCTIFDGSERPGYLSGHSRNPTVPRLRRSTQRFFGRPQQIHS